MNANVKKYEDKGRAVAYNYFSSIFTGMTWYPLPNTYDYIDVQLTGSTSAKTYTADVEIKVREIDYNKFDTLFMECDKYEHLMSYSDNTYKLYFNYFPKNDKIVIYTLNCCDIDKVSKGIQKCNRTTKVNDRPDIKINKLVYELPKVESYVSTHSFYLI